MCNFCWDHYYYINLTYKVHITGASTVCLQQANPARLAWQRSGCAKWPLSSLSLLLHSQWPMVGNGPPSHPVPSTIHQPSQWHCGTPASYIWYGPDVKVSTLFRWPPHPSQAFPAMACCSNCILAGWPTRLFLLITSNPHSKLSPAPSALLPCWLCAIVLLLALWPSNLEPCPR